MLQVLIRGGSSEMDLIHHAAALQDLGLKCQLDLHTRTEGACASLLGLHQRPRPAQLQAYKHLRLACTHTSQASGFARDLRPWAP